MSDICPTKDDIVPQALALLPRGRAWQTHDGGPYTGSTLRQFWTAIAAVVEFANRRICDLRAEFWCATRAETNDLWLAEYGLPDACDPFPDLCTKVAALGGSTCEYYTEVARLAGWAIRCTDTGCGDVAGCALAGIALPGGRTGGSIVIEVDLSESPAYEGGYSTQPYAGALQAGLPLACPPDISPLACILERVVHAHIRVDYVTVAPPTYIMANDTTHLGTEDGRYFVTG